jgi:hypothetical protein
MATGAGKLHLRLFLEGIEVPVIAATVASTPNSPIAAAIQIIPTDAAFLLLERTTVHLFFYDYIDEKAVGDDRYKLLFAGDLVGFGFSKDPQSRSLVVQCLDHTNIWDTTFQYYMNFGGDNTNLDQRHTAVGGVNSTELNDQISAQLTIMNIIRDGATSPSLPRSFPGLQGLMGGIVHLLEELGGVIAGGKLQGRGVNPFYVGYNLRNRVIDQVFAAAKDQTSVNLFELSTLDKIISERDFGQGGFRLSLREMLNTLLGYIYFSDVHICTPKYEANAGKATQTNFTENSRAEVQLTVERIFMLEQVLATTKSAKTNIGIAELLQKLAAPVITEGDPHFRKQLKEKATSQGALENFIDEEKRVLKKLKSTIDVGEAQRLGRLHTVVFRPDMYFLPPPKCNVVFPEMYEQFQFTRRMLEEPTRLFVDTGHFLVDQNKPLVRAFRHRALAPIAIPSVDGNIAGGSLLGASAELQKTIIMPHERFTGILPGWATLPDLAVYFQRAQRESQSGSSANPSKSQDSYLIDSANFEFFKMRFASREMSIQGKFNPYLALGFPALVIDKPKGVNSEDVSVDQFLRTNVESEKDLQVQEVLDNQNTGRPVVDKVAVLDPKSTRDSFQTGIHFVGMIGSLQHVLNQEGGTTAFQMVNVHTHNEAIRFQGELLSVSLEDFLFPGWFDKLYRPEVVSEFYDEAIGSRSILDFSSGVDRSHFELAANEVSQSNATLSEANQKVIDAKDGVLQSKNEALELRKRLEKITPQRPDIVIVYNSDPETGYHNLTTKTVAEVVHYDDVAVYDITLRGDEDSPDKVVPGNSMGFVLDRLFELSENTAAVQTALALSEGLVGSARFRTPGGEGLFFNFVNSINVSIKLAQVIKGIEDALGPALTKIEEAESIRQFGGFRGRNQFTNSVRASVEEVVQAYARIKSQHGEATQFVHQFIFREIATLPQMIGPPGPLNLPGIPSTPGATSPAPVAPENTGFFSYAFGTLTIPGADQAATSLTDKGALLSPAEQLDPRKERQEAVLRYFLEVKRGAALG